MKTACVYMTGPDVQMDSIGQDYFTPANPLPIRCPHCTFPDIDFIPNPYLLTKGTDAPRETSSAWLGNFLVRERVRRILEVAVPGACTFHPTVNKKTKAPVPWWLAVPVQKLKTIRVVHQPLPPACSKCGEAKHAFGDDWKAMTHFDSGGVDIFKSLDWGSVATAEDSFESYNRERQKNGIPLMKWSELGVGVKPPTHPERWTRRGVDRDLYFSVRLEQLFKRAKVKGQLVRMLDFKDVKPSLDDEAWIAEKLKLLAEHGLANAPTATTMEPGAAARKWLKDFLKKNAAQNIKSVDFSAVEKKHKITLPLDYKDFISNVGEKSFADVNDLEGSTTTILMPENLDFEGYRRGKVADLEGEDAEVDGVMFAATDFGDCFVFDVSAKGNDYPVYWYKHEEHVMEWLAPNFAECIKRFAKKD